MEKEQHIGECYGGDRNVISPIHNSPDQRNIYTASDTGTDRAPGMYAGQLQCQEKVQSTNPTIQTPQFQGRSAEQPNFQGQQIQSPYSEFQVNQPLTSKDYQIPILHYQGHSTESLDYRGHPTQSKDYNNPQSQPPLTQSQPPHFQVQPPHSQGQPAQGQPPHFQGQSPHFQSQPTYSQGQTQGQTLHFQGQPPQSQGQPPQSQGQPPHSEGQSPHSQCQPLHSQDQPPNSQGQPPHSQDPSIQQPHSHGRPPSHGPLIHPTGPYLQYNQSENPYHQGIVTQPPNHAQDSQTHSSHSPNNITQPLHFQCFEIQPPNRQGQHTQETCSQDRSHSLNDYQTQPTYFPNLQHQLSDPKDLQTKLAYPQDHPSQPYYSQDYSAQSHNFQGQTRPWQHQVFQTPPPHPQGYPTQLPRHFLDHKTQPAYTSHFQGQPTQPSISKDWNTHAFRSPDHQTPYSQVQEFPSQFGNSQGYSTQSPIFQGHPSQQPQSHSSHRSHFSNYPIQSYSYGQPNQYYTQGHLKDYESQPTHAYPQGYFPHSLNTQEQPRQTQTRNQQIEPPQSQGHPTRQQGEQLYQKQQADAFRVAGGHYVKIPKSHQVREPEHYQPYGQPERQSHMTDEQLFREGHGSVSNQPDVAAAERQQKKTKENTKAKIDHSKKKEMAKPKESEKSYVCVKGLAAKTGTDALCLYLENKSGCEVDTSSTFITSNNTMAVVTLLQTPTNFAEFKTKCQQKHLDGAAIKICQVPAPVTAVVTSEQRLSSTDELREHFQQEKYGGVKVKKVKMSDDGYYTIEFKDNNELEKICHSPFPHKIKNATLCVTALYECKFGDIWEEDKHKVCIPEDMELKHDDKQKMKLMRNYPNIRNHLESILKTKYAKLKTEEGLLVECTLDQNTPDVRRIVKVWKSDILESWSEFINVTIKQIEISVTMDVWHELNEHVKKHQDHSTVQVRSKAHQGNMALVIVGLESVFSTVSDDINQYRDRIEKALERKKQITTRIMKFKPFEIRLLDSLGILTQANSVGEDLKVTINEETDTVTFDGVQEDINSAKNIISDATQKFYLWTTRKDSVTREQVRLLQNREVHEQLKTKFVEQNLVVDVHLSGDTLEIGTESSDVGERVTKIINETILTTDVTLNEKEMIEVLDTVEWRQLCRETEANNNGLVSISTRKEYGYTVSSIDTVHKDILVEMRDFIESKQRVCDTYDIPDENKRRLFEKHLTQEIKAIETELTSMSVTIENKGDKGLCLTGTSHGNQKAKERLKELETRIQTRHYDIDKCSISIAIPNDNPDIFCDIENVTSTVIVQEKREIYSRIHGTDRSGGRTDRREIPEETQPPQRHVNETTKYQNVVTCKNGLRIKLVKGEIGTEQADVLVASTSQDLKLTSGGAGKSLMKYGGPGLQSELQTKFPEKINHGTIVTIAPGKLQCKQVYLSSLPEWEKDRYNKPLVITKIILECLNKASAAGYDSVTFVTMGTGALKYPAQKVAEVMYDAVLEFDTQGTTSVSLVTFVLYSGDHQSHRAFEKEERSLKSENLPSSSPHERYSYRSRFNTNRDVSHPSTRHSNFGPFSSPMQPAATDPLRISVETCNIAEFTRADVIAATVSNDLDLLKGGTTAALAKQAGSLRLRHECSRKYPRGINIGDLAELSPGKLSCKALYLGTLPSYNNGEVKERALFEYVRKVLETAASKGYTSVAFPAVGTGFNRYPHDLAASLCYKAVRSYDRTHPGSIKFVYFVIIQKDIPSLQAFQSEDRKRKGIRYGASNSPPPQHYRGSRGLPCGRGRDTLSDQAYDDADVSRLSLRILGTSDDNINDAIDRIKVLIDKKYMSKQIHDTLIEQLSDKEVTELKKLTKKCMITAEINRQASAIKVLGPVEEVGKAMEKIHQLLRQLQAEKHEESTAHIVSALVQWYSKGINSRGMLVLSEYSPHHNKNLEEAWKNNQYKYIFREENVEYEVNFKMMKEYSMNDPADSVDVLRREIRTGGVFDPPSDWVDMPDPDVIVDVFPLAASSQKFKDIETMFTKSVLKGQYQNQFNASKLKVHRVERIQNRPLYQQYAIMKDLLKKKNPQGTTNEQILWHGTGEAAITSINYYGFNRSYCGGDEKKGDCWYGEGVYFANDASYSARDWVSPLTPSNQKKMYLCKVLTGVCCNAKKGMRYLPPLPNNPSENYDSAVKRHPSMPNPFSLFPSSTSLMEYVIFNDTQSYPEFLITFSTK